jgi:CheY-like chemotaxis protein
VSDALRNTQLPAPITSITGGRLSRTAPATDGPIAATPQPAPTGASDRILLVEDNPVNQRVALAMLENLGFCVDVVDNGVEAVIASTMVPYRAILMDCQIPALNGFDATAEIRDQWGASRLTPIIAVSTSATAHDKARGAAVGMNGFLAKPLSVETLAAGMARWAPDRSGTGDDTSAPVTPQEPAGSRHDPPATTRPVFDLEVVERLQRLGDAAGEDLMGQLAAVFLTDAENRMVALRRALADDDGPALMLQAHTLCGASANLGALELSRVCAQLATDGAVGDSGTGAALLGAVASELEHVRLALVDIVDLPPSSGADRPSLSPRPAAWRQP